MGRGGLICGNSVPKFELDYCSDHWGGPFGPRKKKKKNLGRQ